MGRLEKKGSQTHGRAWVLRLAFSIALAALLGSAVFFASLISPATADEPGSVDYELQELLGPAADKPVSASVAGVSGNYYGDALRVSLRNTSDRTVYVHVPLGLRLIPNVASVQTMYTAGGETIEVPPGGGTILIKGFCGEKNDAPPTDDSSFSVDEDRLFADERLMSVLREVQRQKAWNEVGQRSVWHVTDDASLDGYPGAAKIVEEAERNRGVPIGRSAAAGAVVGAIALVTGLAVSGGGGSGAPTETDYDLDKQDKGPSQFDLIEDLEKPKVPDDVWDEWEPPPQDDEGPSPHAGGSGPSPSKGPTPPSGPEDGSSGAESTIPTDGSPPWGEEEPPEKPTSTSPGGDEAPEEGTTSDEGESAGEGDDATEGGKSAGEGSGEGKPEKTYVRIPVPPGFPGDVRVDPESGEVVVSDGVTSISKEGATYVLSKDGRVLVVDHDTHDWRLETPKHTFAKDGTQYIVTDGNKLLMVDKDGSGVISDGNVAVGRKGENEYVVAANGTVIKYDRATDAYTVDTGLTKIAGKGGQQFMVSGGGQVIEIDRTTDTCRVTNGETTVGREGKTYIVTDDKKVLAVSKDGTGALLTKNFGVVRPNKDELILTDGKVLMQKSAGGQWQVTDGITSVEGKSGETLLIKSGGQEVISVDHVNDSFKVSDGRFVVSRESGSGYVVGADDRWVKYDPATHSGELKTPRLTMKVAPDRTITVFDDNRFVEYNPLTKDVYFDNGRVIFTKEGAGYGLVTDDAVLQVNTDTGTATLLRPHGAYMVGKGGSFGIHKEVPARIFGEPGKVAVTVGRTPGAGGEMKTQWSALASDKRGYFASVAGDSKVRSAAIGRDLSGDKQFVVQFRDDPRLSPTWMTEDEAGRRSGTGITGQLTVRF